MLRCTIEIIPGGIEDHPGKRTLGVVEIANVSNLAEISDYKVVAFKVPPVSRQQQRACWRQVFMPAEELGVEELFETVDVSAFPRNKLGPYDLLYRALRELVKDRSPT